MHSTKKYVPFWLKIRYNYIFLCRCGMILSRQRPCSFIPLQIQLSGGPGKSHTAVVCFHPPFFKFHSCGFPPPLISCLVRQELKHWFLSSYSLAGAWYSSIYRSMPAVRRTMDFFGQKHFGGYFSLQWDKPHEAISVCAILKSPFFLPYHMSKFTLNVPYTFTTKKIKCTL